MTPPPTPDPPVSLLVIEDDPSIALVLEEILASSYEVRLANGPDAALSAIAERRPDLLLMDVNLSAEIDGIELSERVKSRFGYVPHCFLTAYSDPATLARAEQTEPVGYLVKPFEAKDVLAMVAIGVANARRQKERAHSAARLDLALRDGLEAVLFCDSSGQLLAASDAARRVLGIPDSDSFGQQVAGILNVAQDAGEESLLVPEALRAAAAGERFQRNTVLQRPDRSTVPVEVTVSADLGIGEYAFHLRLLPQATQTQEPKNGSHGQSPQPAATDSPASRALAPEDGLIDSVTGLPNRKALEAKLTESGERPSGFLAAILVDHLPIIRQRYGRPAEDQVMLAYSQHLAEHLPPECALGRWSENSFVTFPRPPIREQLDREVSRAVSLPMLHHLQMYGRSALLRISARASFYCFSPDLPGQIDTFVSPANTGVRARR